MRRQPQGKNTVNSRRGALYSSRHALAARLRWVSCSRAATLKCPQHWQEVGGQAPGYGLVGQALGGGVQHGCCQEHGQAHQAGTQGWRAAWLLSGAQAGMSHTTDSAWACRAALGGSVQHDCYAKNASCPLQEHEARSMQVLPPTVASCPHAGT
eukprot:scaffold40186_cov24-Tisochrysis_lutea.AAC.1